MKTIRNQILMAALVVVLMAGLVSARTLGPSSTVPQTIKADTTFAGALTNAAGQNLNGIIFTSATLATGTNDCVITNSAITTSSNLFVFPMGPFTGFSSAPTITVARSTGSATVTITATGTRTVTVPLAVIIQN